MPRTKRPGSTSRPGNVLNLVLSDAQQSRFEILYTRPIHNTRYVDEDILTQMGIYDNLMHIFHDEGWEQLLTSKWPTYLRLTLEFLSTLEVHSSHMTFRLGNEERRLNFGELSSIFGLPIGGQSTSHPRGFNANEFWNELTREWPYTPRAAKASYILNPIF